MKALLRDAMPELLTVSTPTTEAEKLATKVDVAAKGLTVAGRVHDSNMYTSSLLRQVISLKHETSHKTSYEG